MSDLQHSIKQFTKAVNVSLGNGPADESELAFYDVVDLKDTSLDPTDPSSFVECTWVEVIFAGTAIPAGYFHVYPSIGYKQEPFTVSSAGGGNLHDGSGTGGACGTALHPVRIRCNRADGPIRQIKILNKFNTDAFFVVNYGVVEPTNALESRGIDQKGI